MPMLYLHSPVVLTRGIDGGQKTTSELPSLQHAGECGAAFGSTATLFFALRVRIFHPSIQNLTASEILLCHQQ